VNETASSNLFSYFRQHYVRNLFICVPVAGLLFGFTGIMAFQLNNCDSTTGVSYSDPNYLITTTQVYFNQSSYFGYLFEGMAVILIVEAMVLGLFAMWPITRGGRDTTVRGRIS
jgi:hypothetical protein